MAIINSEDEAQRVVEDVAEGTLVVDDSTDEELDEEAVEADQQIIKQEPQGHIWPP